jgi:beta-glucosidase
LRGFERVHLPAGSTRHVHLDLSSRDLSLVNESGDRVIVPGDYTLTIGGGQPGTGAPSLQASFAMRGRQVLPE